MKLVFFVVLLLQHVLNGGDAYRILGIFPAAAYSHFALGSRLMKGFAEKGHDVTIIAPFKEKNPPKFYREIVVEELVTQMEGKILFLFLLYLLRNNEDNKVKFKSIRRIKFDLD